MSPTIKTDELWKILPLCVSTLALVIALRNYRRKSGISISGSFSISSSVECPDPFVSDYVIENEKDRSVTIYGVYLRVGCAYYIELETFDDSPLILKPFETYRKSFGPIEFYGCNLSRFDMRPLLTSRKTKRRLVLSCSEGKYTIKRRAKRWLPVTEFFDNYSTGILRTVRTSYKGVDFGANVSFCVELSFEDGTEKIMPLSRDDYRSPRFRDFMLTRESLLDKTSLTAFLSEQIREGNLKCVKFEVRDLDALRKVSHKFYVEEHVKAPELSAFQYYVLAKVGMWLQSRRMREENKKFSIARRKAKGKTPPNETGSNEPSM